MAKGRCSLCGGKLSGGRCTLCGLDNSIYRRERSYAKSGSSRYGSWKEERSHTAPPAQEKPLHSIPHTQKPETGHAAGGRQKLAGNVQRPGRGSAVRRKPGTWGCITAVIILAAVLLNFLPDLIEFGEEIIRDISGESSDSGMSGDTYDVMQDYDPYEYVTRQIPAAGEPYETVAGAGVYKVGVHIPEGVYRAELEEGSGALSISDEENGIYYSVYFDPDEGYGWVTEEDDIRLYNGAELKIDSGVILKLSAENAQPLVQTAAENPLTEPVTLEAGTYVAGEGELPEGIYDITAKEEREDEYGYTSISIIYPNGSTEFFWVDGPDYALTTENYTDISVKNIVIPAGTEISVEYGDAVLTPGEGYYDVDYSQYMEQ